MEKGLERLMGIIEAQSTCYRELLESFQAERDAIVKSDIDRLNAVIHGKEQLLERIRQMEQQRIGAVESLAEILDEKATDLTLKRLAGLVGEPYASRLQALGNDCRQLFETVQTESSANRSLCLHALAFVNGSLKLLGQLAATGQVYRASGQVHVHETPGRVLSGAA